MVGRASRSGHDAHPALPRGINETLSGPGASLLPDRRDLDSKRDGLLAAGSFYGEGHRFLSMDWMAAVDIDDMTITAWPLALAHIGQQEMR